MDNMIISVVLFEHNHKIVAYERERTFIKYIFSLPQKRPRPHTVLI